MNIAIIGCGLIGQKRAKLLNNVKMVCDVDINKAERLASTLKNCGSTCSVDEVLNSDIDVVILSVPNNELYNISLKVIEIGKHILIEKPGSIHVNDLIKLKTLAEKSGSLVRIGYNHRYHPACLKARDIIKNTDFGDTMFVRGRYGHGGRVGYEKEWRANPALSGGGELIDQGVHLIDLSSIFLGKFEHIDGQVHTYFWNMDVDDNAFLNLKNRHGNVAWLHVSCTEWKNLFSLEIYGKHDKLHWEGLGGSYGIEKLTHYKMSPKMGPPETICYEYPMGDSSWKLEMDEFFEDIKLNRIPVPGLEEGISVLSVVDKIYNKLL